VSDAVTSSGSSASLTVAVLTYRRPVELAALLPELVKQSKECGRRAGVVVIDNDPAGSAGSLCADFDVRYVHEPRPGIAVARNRALDEVATDLLVFIDDDERPVDGWLRVMLEMADSTGVAAIVGPVVSEYSVPLDSWMAAGRFFDRRRLPTGTPVDVAATNNLLLDMRRIREWGLRFDERFGLTGGSDTLFTRQIGRNGGTLLWCDEALVYDVVPASRLTRRWVLQRALRSGNSWSRTTIDLAGSAPARMRARVTLTGTGLIRTTGGATRAAAGVLLRRDSHQAKGLRTLARGVGMLSGAYGYVYSEYRRKPQTSAPHQP
jgi:succinoglycan biosynthesis protein ExoM